MAVMDTAPPTVATADLIRLTVDGVDYVGIPRALAGPVGQCIRGALTAAAKSAGADVPRHLPLWAVSLQLEVEARLAATAEVGSRMDVGEPVPALSVHDVAKQLGLKPRGVRDAALHERLRGAKVGAVWTFRQVDVDDFAERRASA